MRLRVTATTGLCSNWAGLDEIITDVGGLFFRTGLLFIPGVPFAVIAQLQCSAVPLGGFAWEFNVTGNASFFFEVFPAIPSACAPFNMVLSAISPLDGTLCGGDATGTVSWLITET
jgi:hypothetical protein